MISRPKLFPAQGYCVGECYKCGSFGRLELFVTQSGTEAPLCEDCKRSTRRVNEPNKVSTILQTIRG